MDVPLFDLIENVQRNFTKCIPSLSSLPYTERHALLDLDFLELRRLRFDLIYTIKCLITSHPLTPMRSSLCIPLPRGLDLKCHTCRNQLKQRIESSQPLPLEALMRGTLYQQLCHLLPLFLYLNDTYSSLTCLLTSKTQLVIWAFSLHFIN
jgi:hypothetical protein